MHSSRSRHLAVAVTMATVGLVGVACADDESTSDEGVSEVETPSTGSEAGEVQTIRIGLITSLSGNIASLGPATQEAMELAIAQVNEEGLEVGGERYEFELVVKDDRSDPNAGVAAATELVEDEGVDIIFGPPLSTIAPSVAQLVLPQGVLMLSPALALDELLTEDGLEGDAGRLFRTNMGNDVIQAALEGVFETQFPDAESIAFVVADEPSAAAIADQTAAAAEASGVEVVAREAFPTTATDFQTILTTVRDADADVMLICCRPDATIGLVRQAVELGIETPLLAVNSQLSIALSLATGEPIPMPFVNVFQPAVLEPGPDGNLITARPSVDAYAQQVVDNGGEVIPTTSYGFYFHDYVLLLAQAMEAAGTVDDNDAIAEALESAEVDGVVGRVRFTERHTSVTDVDVCRVETGEVTCDVIAGE